MSLQACGGEDETFHRCLIYTTPLAESGVGPLSPPPPPPPPLPLGDGNFVGASTRFLSRCVGPLVAREWVTQVQSFRCVAEIDSSTLQVCH